MMKPKQLKAGTQKLDSTINLMNRSTPKQMNQHKTEYQTTRHQRNCNKQHGKVKQTQITTDPNQTT